MILQYEPIILPKHTYLLNDLFNCWIILIEKSTLKDEKIKKRINTIFVLNSVQLRKNHFFGLYNQY